MPKVLVPLAPGCEEIEAVTVIDILRRAGIEVVSAGLDAHPVRASRDTVLLPDATLDEAYERMQQENPNLSPAQVRHLTEHGVSQNEDGSYSWKFDNYVRVNPPYDMSYPEIETLWTRITCPTLLIYGKESWASNPEKDGRLKYFKTAKVLEFENAGHWVHHDRLDAFVDTVRGFIA